MQGIETCHNLHFFCVVDGFAVCHIYTGLFERRTSVRKFIFNYKILRLFRIYERSDKGIFFRNNRSHFLNTRSCQSLLNRLSRARSNFINHCPRKRNIVLVPHPIGKILGNKAAVKPLVHYRHNTHAQLLAVAGTVIHADNSKRKAAGFKTLKEQRSNDAHRMRAVRRTAFKIRFDKRKKIPLNICQRIPFFGYSKADHLKRRLAKDRAKLLHIIRKSIPCPDSLRYRSYYFFLYFTVGKQTDQ